MVDLGNWLGEMYRVSRPIQDGDAITADLGLDADVG